MTSVPPINGFTQQRLLGRGNSAWVYLATDRRGRRVALKLPFPTTISDTQHAERFANEVRLSLRLRHAHLVAGYEGTPFGPGSHLAMRYFPEGTLAGRLESGQLPREAGMQILADVAQALAYLHGQSIVHQDVKPQNVYLDEGRAALGDFGAAYFVAQGGKPAGSPFYMAPEIYRGEPSSFASDVYSLAVLAYEVISGERPFTGASYDALMAAHLSRYPRPITGLVPDLPRPLVQLIERSFAKTPDERPQARELADALLTTLAQTTGSAERTTTAGTTTGITGVTDSTRTTSVPLSPPPPAPESNPKLGRHSAARTTIVDTPASSAEPQPDETSGRGPWWNPFKKRPAR